MDYKARLKAMRNNRIAGTIKRAEQERKLRHEIAMDELAAARGLHGLSSEDRCIIEAATIEILTIDSVLNTVPEGKRKKMMAKAVKKAMSSVAADLIAVVKAGIEDTENKHIAKGNYTASRIGPIVSFGYFGFCYVSINVADRTFTIMKVPTYATARRMVRYLAELCELTLPDMQEAVYNFEVIHEIDL